MRKVVLLFFLTLFCAELSAQNKYFRSLDLDSASNLAVTPYFNKNNKECVMISSSLRLDTGDAYNKFVHITHLTKFDSANNIFLDKSFTLVNKNIGIRSTIKLLQGGYLGYGYYFDSKLLRYGLAGVPGCIIIYNENGDTLFTKKFPYRKDYSFISSLKQLPDSSIIFVCSLSDSNLSLSSMTGIRVVKLNKDFSTAWDKVFYYNETADPSITRVMYYFDALNSTLDKGVLIGFGEYIQNADTTYHAVLFKIDNKGNFLWEHKFYGNDYYSSIIKIIQLRDGNFLLIGNLSSYFRINPKVTDFVFLIKVNAQGQLIWKRLISKYEYQFALDAAEYPNGNILIAGQMDVRGNTHVYDNKAYLICVSKNGNILWEREYEVPSNKTYGEISDVDFSDVEIANDNSILALGSIVAYDSAFPYNNHWNPDFLFLHADSIGCIMPGSCPFAEIERTFVEPNYFYAYPNPTSSTISFKSNLTHTSAIQIKMINALGQVVFEKKLENFEEHIDVRSFNKGIYFVELKADDFVGTQKIVVE